MMRLFICGHAQHGKDTVAQILWEEFGLSYADSSVIAMREFLRDQLAENFGLHYESELACYQDRVNHRAAWFSLIADYNAEDPARLARRIFSLHHAYVGIRNAAEFAAARKLATFSLWVDASERMVAESFDSNTMTPDMCDVVVRNNGTLEDLRAKLWRVFHRLPLDASLPNSRPVKCEASQ